MKKTLPKLTLIISGVLLSTILILVFARAHSSSALYSLDDLNPAITPTPYPLPTQAYNQPSTLTKVFRQLFQKRNSSIDPTRILETGQPVAENPYFVLYATDGYLPVEIEWWQQASESVYQYVSQRLGMTLNGPVFVTFIAPQTGNCPPRGTSFHEQQSLILIFAGEDTSQEQILATLAHELGHVFIQKKFENLTDIALIEGLATWTAGDYWTAWKESDFDASVKTYLNNGTYLPLFSNYDLEAAYDNQSPDCITNRDILLTEIASFIDFLLQNYGMENFSRLAEMKQPATVNSRRVIYPPDYPEAFGLELNQLEYRWLISLDQSD